MDALLASRACLRSLKEVDLEAVGAGAGLTADDVDGISDRVDTGFMKSSEMELAVDVEGLFGSSAAFACGLVEAGESVEAEAGATVSTILIGTRRRFGAASLTELLEALGTGVDFELEGAETSIGVRF